MKLNTFISRYAAFIFMLFAFYNCQADCILIQEESDLMVAEPPCDNPKAYTYTVHGYDIAILYCLEGNEISYAEIDQERTEIKDEEVWKEEIAKFYKYGYEHISALPPEKPIEVEAAAAEEKLYKKVEQMPRFPGCEHLVNEGFTQREIDDCAKEKMIKFIYNHVRYPAEALKAGLEGTAVMRFTVVGKDGYIQDIELLRDPGMGIGDDAISIVEAMNHLEEGLWTPGIQRGKAVKVQYTLPIKYKLR